MRIQSPIPHPKAVSPDGLAPSVRHGAVTAVVCIALAAVVAAMSSLNVAIPSIAGATHASQTQLAWIIDAYSLVFAALLLPAGALGDRFGRRRALLTGLTIFGVGSAVAMTVSDANQLIALRTVIGLNVVLAVIAIIGTFMVVPESANRSAPRLDRGGAALSVIALVALVYSIIEAPTAGWLSTRTLIGIGFGLAALASFIVYELRQRTPMLDPRVFGRRGLSAGSLSIFVQFFAFYGFIFLILQYLQVVRGYSALIAAVSMLPMAATMMPTARFAPARSAGRSASPSSAAS